MKKRSSRTKPKTTRKAPPAAPVPDRAGQSEALNIANTKYPLHESELVASVAAQLAAGRAEISREEGAQLARSALNLLDAVQETVSTRARHRAATIRGLEATEAVPFRLKWNEGIKYILKTDGGGSEAKFLDLLKAKISWDKLRDLRSKHVEAGNLGPEPNLEDVPQTTPKELNELVTSIRKEDFSREELRTLRYFYTQWRPSVDKRRKKK